MTDVKLSKNFSLSELTYSQTASRHGINNVPSKAVQSNLSNLVTEILQPLRDKLKKPITISSGYRSIPVNRKVGGSDTSAHVYGYAVDMNSHTYGTTKEFALYVHQFLVKNKIPFDQLIYEFGSWVHVATKNRSGKQRGQVLTAKSVNGKTVYLNGIV